MDGAIVSPTVGRANDGTLADWFRIGEELGRGANGRVYKAEDLVTGQTVAIKKISLGLTAAQDNLQSVMGEIELLKELNHQNIVKCLGSFRTSSYLYIVLEYMDEGSLASIIKQMKLSEGLASVYIVQVLQGLRYLHQQGVVHRDIKGANILARQGIVKLADFGVSAKLGELELTPELQQQVAGSPYWMAPEVIEMNQSITGASDIWSVGCLVIEALTGNPPYFDLQPMSALFRIVADDHPPLPAGISPLMESFLLQCFQKDPAKRPSADELLRHEWISEQRRKLPGTWRALMPSRSRISDVAFDSLNSILCQDLEGGQHSMAVQESRQGHITTSEAVELLPVLPEASTASHWTDAVEPLTIHHSELGRTSAGLDVSALSSKSLTSAQHQPSNGVETVMAGALRQGYRPITAGDGTHSRDLLLVPQVASLSRTLPGPVTIQPRTSTDAFESVLQRRSVPSPPTGASPVRQRKGSNPHAPVYDRLFTFADRNGDGRVTGPEAAPFFERSGLPREVLFRIWDLADNKKRGYLDNQAFYNAMDAISLAQDGYELNKTNWDIVQSRREGFILPRLRGFKGDGTPDGSEAIPTGPNASTSTVIREASATGPNSSLWNRLSGRKKPPAKPVPMKVCTSINDGLKELYFKKIRQIEETYKFSHFFTSAVTLKHFDSKPTVLLLGQYSTGKTTFIEHLLKRSYPGAHVGPEPTTDRFVIVHQGVDDRRIPGDALTLRKDLPYQGLARFGTGFLNRLEGAQCQAPLLEEVTIVDTPGLLSGEKQRNDHSYNFLEVCRWFANHSDLILLFFDPEKLDISDELRQVLKAISMHSDKLCVVLNKATQVHPVELMRIHGALMWGLGRVFPAAEMLRVCIGSFTRDKPALSDRDALQLSSLFADDEAELLGILHECPRNSCDRKVSELLKRLRACKVHLLLLEHLRKQLSYPGHSIGASKLLGFPPPNILGLGGVARKGSQRWRDDLHHHFIQVQRQHHLPIGDFPDPYHFGEILSSYDFSAFPKVTAAMIKQIDDAINIDIPALTKEFENPW